MKPRTTGEDPVFSSAVSKILGMLGSLLAVFSEARETFRKGFDRFLRRVEYLFLIYLWVSVGMVFLLLGGFFLVIDAGWASRGTVFFIGGLLVFLVSMVLLQTATIRKEK